MRLIPKRKKSSRRRSSSLAEVDRGTVSASTGLIPPGTVVEVSNRILGRTADNLIIDDPHAETYSFVGLDMARGPDRTAIATFRGVPFVADPAVPEDTIAFMRSLPPRLRYQDIVGEYNGPSPPTPMESRLIANIVAQSEARVAREFGISQEMLNTPPAGTETLTLAMIQESIEQLRNPQTNPIYRERTEEARRDRHQRAEALMMLAQSLPFQVIRPEAVLQMMGLGEYPRPRVDPETAQRSMERARGLLRSLLRPEQWAEFERTRKFTERIGEDEFEVTPGGMITRHRGNLAERWCINPDPYADNNDYMPAEDMAIAQLLHLRAGPEKLRAQANVFPGR